MSNVALISVIVPVYKVEKYLPRCIDSILAQSYRNFELILVDDGSPDNCGIICDEYAEKDSRVYVIHKKNGGRSDARNVGLEWVLKTSDSKWIGFIDSDDWIHPRYLEALYEGIKEYNCKISSMQLTSVKINEDIKEECNQSISISVESMEDVYSSFGKRVTCYTQGRLYKKTLWEDIRFPFGKNWEDIATTYKVLLKANQIALIHNDLYYYFINDEGITAGSWTPKHLEELEAYEQQLNDKRIKRIHKVYKRLREQYLWSIRGNIDSALKAQLAVKEKKRLVRYLRRKLRLALIKYSKGTDCDFKHEKYIFEGAYPNLMNVYWILRAKLLRI